VTRRGGTPNAVTYNIYMATGFLDEACHQVDIMLSRGLLPTVETVSILFFFEKTQEMLRFISLNRKKTTGVQPPEGGTHTHNTHTTVLTKRLQLGKEVPSTTDRNNIRPRLALPPTKNGEAFRLGTTGQRHRRCQTLPRTIAAPRLLRPTYLTPIMCQESRQVGGRA
jgi:hypothetical protein